MSLDMGSAQETVKAIQTALEPYIRPREEAEHIRRVLALHLRSCYEHGPERGPLALAESDCTIKTTSDVRGLQREYLKALHQNIKAQREYETVSQQPAGKLPNKNSSPKNDHTVGRLDNHITTLKLKRKQERLQTVEKYLNALAQKTAASPDFLQSDENFSGNARLPEVPKNVVSGFTVDKEAPKTDLKALVDRLEKAVLRSKLLLKKEEQLLEKVKSRSTVSPGKIDDAAKLAALSATRNELISWMETELGKASAAEESVGNEGDGTVKGEINVNKDHMDQKLLSIKEKYAIYVAARKSLIQLVAQNPRPSIKPPEDTMRTTGSDHVPAAHSNHLIIPYIEKLLSVSQEQKTAISQKSHLNNVLAKQTEETCRALDRLAEESQLLPDHAGPGASRDKQGLGGNTGHEITDHVKPWVAAADAAKLATLEAVAEKIEEGQVALESSTKYLAEIDQLLGRGAAQVEEAADEDSTVDDIWLAETQSPNKGTAATSRLRSKSVTIREPKDIWLTLDGNLGLINAEDSPWK